MESVNIWAVRDDAERARLDFIRADLDLLFTFTEIVKTAHGMQHHQHAQRTLAKAEKGYSDLLRLFSQANRLTPETEREFNSMFADLRKRLDSLQQLVNGKWNTGKP